MDIKNLLILTMVKGVGPAFLKRNRYQLSNAISCEDIIHEVNSEELDNLSHYCVVADEIIADCIANGIEMRSILDDTYPARLMEIGDPPSVLFMKGDESLLEYVIAIIGTRHSSELGNRIAERVGAYFSDKYSICNGLVEGIDEHSIYHNGLVNKNVVGIISGGLIYKETCSSNHIRVIDDVLKAGGLIISEFYPRQKEDKFSGSRASRIQAGLSHGLILVQSTVEGGSKYTLAKYAKLGRPIGVVHYPSSAEYSSGVFGANRLIIEKGRQGLAQMIGLKKESSMNVGPIISLSSKDDYDLFIQEMSKIDDCTLF